MELTLKLMKTRMWVTVEELVKRAFESRASAIGLTPGELLEKIVREQFPESITHVQQLSGNSVGVPAEDLKKRKPKQ